jgi:hypothetical protein
MCIVDPNFYDSHGNPKNVDVSKTRICVSPCQDANRQLTVYANSVDLDASGVPAAMILPVPNKSGRGSEVRMMDTRDDPDGKKLFDPLRDMFPKFTMFTNSNSWGMQAQSNSLTDETLEVLECGSYIYSVVPTLNDFDRLDKAKLGGGRPSPRVYSVLRERYSDGFSFLVCKLSESSAYHPIAYTHPIVQKNDRSIMFVPTFHEHGEEELGDFVAYSSPNTSPDWDHEIFALGVDDTSRFGEKSPYADTYKSNRFTSSLPMSYSRELPAKLSVAGMRRLELHGRKYPNQDINVLSSAQHVALPNPTPTPLPRALSRPVPNINTLSVDAKQTFAQAPAPSMFSRLFARSS